MFRLQCEESSYLNTVEDASAVVRTNDGELAMLTEVEGSDKLRRTRYLVPYGHLLVWYTPESQPTVQGSTEEIPEAGNRLRIAVVT